MSDVLRIDDVKRIIQDALSAVHVEVRDLTGTSDHFDVTVVSAAFEGKSLIQQHQLVYDALGDAMSGPVHALQLRTQTPAQWTENPASD
jgi:stress-induced morphogen